MEVQNARRSIIRNTLWGKANIAVRYLTSFVATAVIAAKYSPDEFGFYQLIMTYLGILEVVNLLHPNHVRNHLVENPADEQAVASIWFFQSIGIWLISSIIIAICALGLEDSRFWWILLLANIRFFFRAYDYVQIISDYRLRSDLAQKAQMVVVGFFNAIRTVVALAVVPMFVLVGSSPVQGVMAGIYQLYLQKNLGFHFKRSFNWAKYFTLIREGGWLTCVLILGGVQLRIVSALVAERMPAAMFGNFQLVLKLVEPATAVGGIVIAANYTVLTHTLKLYPSTFFSRFLKISLLSLGVALLCGGIISVFPKGVLLTVFGVAYQDAIDLLWLGSGLILGNTVLSISTQYDMMTRRYVFVLMKYVMVFLLYVSYLSFMDAVTVQTSLMLQTIVPILVVVIFDVLRFMVARRDTFWRSS